MKKITDNTSIFYFVSGLLITVFLINGCGSKTSKTKSVMANIDSVKMVLVSLQDSTAKTWQTMINEDDQKIAYMKRLIDEVSYTGVYNKAVYDSLSTGIQNLKEIRYSQTSMSDSEKIDHYDAATSALVSKVIAFAQDHPNFEDYPIMDELINDILTADNQVIYRRVDYDNIATEYNKFIENYHEIIQKSGGVVSTKPLFQLSE